jgi:ribosome-interacting GTPase 1
MEEDLFQRTDKEIEEKISELEHAYAEFLENDAHVHDLHGIRQRILELRQELTSRKGC